jgi:hypothetical protein
VAKNHQPELITRKPYDRIAAARPRPFIPIPSQGGVEFGFEKLLDEAANARAHPSFRGIEPIIAKKMFAIGGADRWLCAIHSHGVISVGALTPILFAFTSWRLRHPQIPTTAATAPLGATNTVHAVAKAMTHGLVAI